MLESIRVRVWILGLVVGLATHLLDATTAVAQSIAKRPVTVYLPMGARESPVRYRIVGPSGTQIARGQCSTYHCTIASGWWAGPGEYVVHVVRAGRRQTVRVPLSGSELALQIEWDWPLRAVVTRRARDIRVRLTADLSVVELTNEGSAPAEVFFQDGGLHWNALTDVAAYHEALGTFSGCAHGFELLPIPAGGSLRRRLHPARVLHPRYRAVGAGAGGHYVGVIIVRQPKLSSLAFHEVVTFGVRLGEPTSPRTPREARLDDPSIAPLSASSRTL